MSTSSHLPSVQAHSWRKLASQLLVLLFCCAVPSLGTAQQSTPADDSNGGQADTEKHAPIGNEPELPGWRVFVDPATGRIRTEPNALQRRALQRIQEPSVRTEELPTFQFRRATSNGSVTGVYLRGAFQSALHVHLDSDGRPQIGCREEHAAIESETREEPAEPVANPSAAKPPHGKPIDEAVQ